MKKSTVLNILLSILILGCIALYACGSYHLIGNDEGSYAYEASLILAGKWPFLDFISRAPAEIAMLALLFLIFGKSMLTLKIMSGAFYVLTGLSVYLLVRMHASRNVALLAGLLTLATPVVFLTKIALGTINLSLPLVLFGIVLIKQTRRAWYFPVCAGVLFGLAALVRETVYIYLIGLCVWLLWKRRHDVLGFIVLGSGAVLALAFGIFATKIGAIETINMLFGVGHVAVAETPQTIQFSLRTFGFFLASAAPLCLLWAMFRARTESTHGEVRTSVITPELLWVGCMIVFYIIYAFKRGFLLSYSSELLPVAIAVIFSTIDLGHPRFASRYATMAATTLCLLALLPYAFVNYNPSQKSDESSFRYSVTRFVGSGIPRYSYDAVMQTIADRTPTNPVVFAGNLAFAFEHGADQFMHISRPMAYSRDSYVYAIYNAPTRETIVSAFMQNPPAVVINDTHMRLSFWPYISDFVAQNYRTVYKDSFARVYILKSADSSR